MGSGAVSAEWNAYRDGWSRAEGEVIGEALMTISINGEEWVTLMCTPSQQDLLAIGFMLNEDLIQGMDDIDHVHVSEDGCCVDVWLQGPVELPRRGIITSGCGRGVTFEEPEADIQPLTSELQISPERLFALFRQLHIPDSLHARARGVHASGLTDGEKILALAEDVGRHNTLDKLHGSCLMQDIATEGLALLATGRISSEMLRKGAKMGCPIIASRNSPTSLSIDLARLWGITLVGYARQGMMRVYTRPDRLGYEAG
ncbi:MAG: formate dehydrogenase accessory sulfurtransferase FdhD [Anaerolineales bacterium]